MRFFRNFIFSILLLLVGLVLPINQAVAITFKEIKSNEKYQLKCPTKKHIRGISKLLDRGIEKVCVLKTVKDGESITIHDNGVVIRRGSYKNGKMDGKWSRWTKEGIIKDIGHWKKGVPEGLWQFWHSNGKLKEEGFYQEGKRFGYWKYYEEDKP